MELLPENQYPSDVGLWKVCAPVVRVKPRRHPNELFAHIRVPFVEPLSKATTSEDPGDAIKAFCVRPPAIPG